MVTLIYQSFCPISTLDQVIHNLDAERRFVQFRGKTSGSSDEPVFVVSSNKCRMEEFKSKYGSKIKFNIRSLADTRSEKVNSNELNFFLFLL